jgi:hypothetical protein
LLTYLPAFEDVFPNRTGDFKHWLVRVLEMLGVFIPVFCFWFHAGNDFWMLVTWHAWFNGSHGSTDQKIPRLSEVG